MKFSSLIMSKLFPGNNAKQSKRNAPRAKNLKLEALENRDLLSVGRGIDFVAPNEANVVGFIGGGFSVEEATAAYEAYAASNVDDVIDLVDVTETVIDDSAPYSEIALVEPSTDVAISVEGAVSGPGRPSEYYDADKSAFNTEDDDMCWAATASNIVVSTGWADLSGLANEQEFFDSIFVGTWPDAGGNTETGVSWYLDGKYLTLYKYTSASSTWAAIGENTSLSIPGGGAYSELFAQYGETSKDYVSGTSVLGVADLSTVATNLQNGAGVGLGLGKTSGSGHAVTCWGYTVDSSLSPSDPGYYTGLYITDSDDEKSGKNNDLLNERKLIYRSILWDPTVQTFYGTGSYRIGNNSDPSPSGSNAYYIDDVVFLAARPEKYGESGPVTTVETPSTIVTTTDDVVDAYDGKISLREAINYANAGDKITFKSALKGKTIALDSELSQLYIGKSLTIDASNLYNTSTNAPGITISGADATRIMWLGQNISVTLKGLEFTHGKSPACGGAIWNNANLTVDKCLFTDNNATYVNDDGSTGNYYGGAIAVKSGAKITARSTTFTGNAGGGVVSFQTDLASTFDACVFQNNATSSLYAVTGDVSATNCEFSGAATYGLYAYQGAITATDCVIKENASYGIYANQGVITATNCVVRDNSSSGIYCAAAGTFNGTNCLVAGNSAYWGAGMEIYGTANLFNCTITGNVASYGGGGVDLDGNAVFTAYNTIIAGNTASTGVDVNKYKDTARAYAYNTLSSYTAWDSGSNNLTYNASKPLFTDATNGDYTLAQNSQAIDKGDNSCVETTVDLANKTRKVNGTVDLGAYEYQRDVDPIQLSAPTNPRVAAKTATTATVAWNAVAHASEYGLIYKKTTDSSYTVVKLDPETTTYKIAGLDNSATYYWRVRAIGDGDSYLTSDYTATRSVKPRQKLATPNEAYAAAATSITVTWDRVPNASAYRIMYKPSGGDYVTVDVNSASATSYKITGLTPDTTYAIKIAAIGDGLDYSSSAYTPLTSVKTPSNQLPTPTNPRETAKTETSITVAWDAVENVSKFGLIYKRTTDSSYTVVKLDPETTTYKITGLDNSATYYWRVRAIGDGESFLTSDYTATRSVAPRQKLATPANESYATTATSITATWDLSPNASAYRIMYKPSGGSYVTVDVNSATATSYTITGLTKDATYAIKIAAIGDGFDYSSSDYTTLTSVKTVPEPTPLDTPNVTLAATASTVSVNWAAVPNAKSYTILYDGTAYNAPTPGYKFLFQTPKKSHSIQVRANGDGTNYLNSSYSASKTISTKSLVELNAPTLTAQSETRSSITVSWRAISGAVGYQIVYVPKSGTGDYVVATVGAGKTSHVFTGLPSSENFILTIQALGDGLETTSSGYERYLYTSTLDTTAALATNEELFREDELFQEDEWFEELDDEYDLIAESLLNA